MKPILTTFAPMSKKPKPALRALTSRFPKTSGSPNPTNRLLRISLHNTIRPSIVRLRVSLPAVIAARVVIVAEIEAMIAVATAVRAVTALTLGVAEAASGAVGAEAVAAGAGVISGKAAGAICLLPSTLLRRAANAIAVMTEAIVETVATAAPIADEAIPIVEASKIAAHAVSLTIAAPKPRGLPAQPIPPRTIFCFPVNHWPSIVAGLPSKLPLLLQ